MPLTDDIGIFDKGGLEDDAGILGPSKKTLSRADIYPGSTEMRAAPGLGERIGEEAGRWGAAAAGTALGGPGAGTGMGLTAADIGIALLHHHLYGTPINLSPSNVTKAAEENVMGSYAAEPIAQGASALGRRLLGRTATEATARTAMDEAAESNVAAQAKLDVAAGKEAAKQKSASAAAAESQGQANLKERGNLYEAAQKAAAANEEMRKQFAQTAPQKLAGEEQKAAQAVLPEAKTATVEATTGQPAGAPTALQQGPTRIARDEQFRETIKAPLQRWRADWGQRRNDLLKPYMDTEVDPSGVRDEIAAERGRWTGRAPYSPKVAALLKDTENMGNPPLEIGTPEGQARVQDILRESGWTRRNFDEYSPQEQLEAAQRSVGGEGSNVTVRDLLARQAEANRIAASSKGADRTAAETVSRGVDKALTGVAPTPELKALNAEYRDHRLNFPYKFDDLINNTPRPVNAAKEIFDQPQRAMDLADLGTSEEKQRLGQLYADWVHEQGPKVIDKSHAPFLGKLYPNSPLRDPRAWVYLDKAEGNVANIVNSSPQVKARWQAAVDVAQADIRRDYSEDLIKAAKKDAPTLGAAGAKLLTEVQRAKTPEDAAVAIARFYQGMTPETVLADALRSGQRTPGVAAYEAAIRAPRTARTAAQTFQGQDLRQAAIDTIQRGYKPSPIWESMRRHARWVFPSAAGGIALSGHPYPYAAAMSGVIGAVGMRELLYRGFQNSLKDPTAATEFFNAMMKPNIPSNMSKIARVIVKSGMADVGSRGIQAATGTSLEENQGDVR